mgnify:CR=1 FL=1
MRVTLTIARQVIQGTATIGGRAGVSRRGLEGSGRSATGCSGSAGSIGERRWGTSYSGSSAGSYCTANNRLGGDGAGRTHIALALRNAVDTKHSKEGDRIYLETIYPVAAGGRITAHSRGSFVNGTVTISKPAGRVKGKGRVVHSFRFTDLAQRGDSRFPVPIEFRRGGEGGPRGRQSLRRTGYRQGRREGCGHDGDGRLSRWSDRSRQGKHHDGRRHRKCGGRSGGVGFDLIEEGVPMRHFVKVQRWT